MVVTDLDAFETKVETLLPSDYLVRWDEDDLEYGMRTIKVGEKFREWSVPKILIRSECETLTIEMDRTWSLKNKNVIPWNGHSKVWIFDLLSEYQSQFGISTSWDFTDCPTNETPKFEIKYKQRKDTQVFDSNIIQL